MEEMGEDGGENIWGGRVIDEDCDGGDGCIKEMVRYVVVEKMHGIFKLNPWLCSSWDLFDEMHQRNVVSWVNDLIDPLYIRNGPQTFQLTELFLS